MSDKAARGPERRWLARVRRHGEHGQAVTAVVILVFALIVGVSFLGVIPLGQATDESGQAGNAADASALAGATAIRERLLDELTNLRFDDRSGLFGTLTCGLGRGGAEDYAARNGAAVTSYCYYPAQDRVEVTVRMLDSAVGKGRTATAGSAAPLGISPARCRFDDDALPHHRRRPSYYPACRPLRLSTFLFTLRGRRFDVAAVPCVSTSILTAGCSGCAPRICWNGC